MCGIAGVIQVSGVASSQLPRLLEALRHRGPDGEGRYEEFGVHMGMRRLSIIDLEGAKQPLYNTKKNVIVCFNGEIYNYVELRTELARSGCHFRTSGDGEVIAHLFERLGPKAVCRLRGMFAISLYDTRTRRFYLFRDRMGEKPIFYHASSGRFVYASELKALRIALDGPVKLSPPAVAQYLAYQYVPEPLTILDGVWKVPAGCYVQFNVDDPKPEIVRYWDMLDAPSVSKNEAAGAVRHALASTLDIIGRSDVPIGIALSGGLDSAIVACLFQKRHGDVGLARAFSVGYTGRPESDERRKARQLASDLGIEMFETEVSPSDFRTDFRRLIKEQDEPIADIAAYAMRAVMKRARESGTKVILNGIGADELFWGYERARQAAAAGYAGSPMFSAETESMFDRDRDYLFAVGVAQRTLGCAYAEFTPDPLLACSALLEHPEAVIMASVCKRWLVSDPIVLGDRLSMAQSIELRSPFLDHTLVELSVGLNKGNPGFAREPGKALLKEAVAGDLPQDILSRPKRGFTPPVARWILEVSLKYMPALRRGYLAQTGVVDIRGLIQSAAQLNMFRRSDVGRLGFYLYKLVLLETWVQVHLLQERAPSILDHEQ